MEEQIPTIDADGHIFEREEDVRKYLGPPFDKRTTPLWPGDQPWDDGLLNTLGNNNPEFQPIPGVRYTTDMSPAEQIEAWHNVMAHSGVKHAVCFPSITRHVATRETAYQIAVARAYNDHVAHEYNALSDRVHCVGVLPMRHPQAAADELRRAATELGVGAFVMHSLGTPIAYGEALYDPIYRAAEELNITLCVHGIRFPYDEVGADRLSTFGEVHAYCFTAGVLLQFTSMVMQGVPVRFPNLRLAFLEIGVTWLPYYLDRLDEHWEKRPVETPLITRKPSEMVRDWNVYFSIEAGETMLASTIDFVGDSHFVYASDIPHWDNEFPGSLERLRAHPDLSRHTKENILYNNPLRLFALKD